MDFCGVWIAAMTDAEKKPFPWIKVAIAVLILCVAGGILAWNLPSEWLDQDRIDALLGEMGALAPIAYILLKTLIIVVAVIPSSPLDVASGALFGPFLGTVYSLIGYETGAVACFFIARALGRRVTSRIFNRDISFCDQCSPKHLALVLFFARLEPIFSFALVSYAAGLTRISLISFIITTLLGLAPATILLNYYGRSFLEGNLPLQIGLGILFVVMVFVIPLWIKRKNPWGLMKR